MAQVISEVLPKDSKEKKLLDGFLAGREHIRRAIEKGDYSLFNGEEEPKKQVTIDQFVRR